jgi:hypothetical protein
MVIEVILIVIAVLIVLFGIFVVPGCFGLWGRIRSRLRLRANREEQYGEWIELQSTSRERAQASVPAPAPIKPAVLKQSKVDDLAPGWEDVELGEVENVRNR